MRNVTPKVNASKGRFRSQKGQSLVELALTLPVVVLLMIGIVDVGFLLYAHVQVSAAAGVGARVAAATVTDATESSATPNDNTRATTVRDAVERAMGRLNTSADWSKTTDVQLQYTTQAVLPTWYNAVTRSGDHVKITVTYRQPVLFDLLPGILPSHKISLSGSAVARLP